MSLNTLITNFIHSSSIESDNPDKKTKQTLSDLKSDPNLKNMSKYVRGGLSKMTKLNTENLLTGLKSYKKGVYMVSGKEIIPDPEQNMIINAPVDKNIRVVAGAGTGKTTTITCRIKYLLDTCTTPDRILVLTFNVESRKNLEIMIDKLMGFEIKIDIRTIDSFCLKIKNDFFGGYETEYTTDRTSLGQQCINRSVSEYGIVGRKIMEKYGAEISSQYKYIFFDEFQDVDEDQFEILRIFAKNSCYLTVIGDDSQNIYQFRGSDNYYIINFDKIIPNTLTYKITTNYRSTKEIVDLANDSIRHNKDKIFKIMNNYTQEKGSIDLTLYETNDESISFIMMKIIEYVEEHHVEYGDIAVLSRNTHPLKILETEFEKNKLPYVSLISDQFSSEFKQIIQHNKIVLSTIHKSKGLEWKIVFLIGLCDAYFPNHLNNGLKNIEEERRLFYVGTTRAKRHLHFVGDKKDLPISRFIGEISYHLDIINHSRYEIDPNVMFSGDDTNKTKDSYSVMKVVEMLSGRKIENLRELELIPNIKLLTEQIFTDPLYYSDELKKNVFESDYGLYCDYYMIRQLMIHNKQDIKDMHVEKILLNLNMTEDEMILYRKYNIKECLIRKKNPDIDPKNIHDIKCVKHLLDKLNGAIKMAKLSPSNIEHLLSMGMQDYQYPKEFIKKLRKSYDLYKNNNITTIDENIINSIYHVSLCPKLNNDRRRLVYRNIQNLYEENSTDVIPRIDEYVKKISNNVILCKLQMNKLFKIDKNTISFVGELDYIDITNDTLVDIKCSEGDFKVEWLIQLLIYYSLFMCNPNCCKEYYDIEIKKLAIINIFTGKYYEIVIPHNYNWENLLDYVRNMIADDIKGIRDVHTNVLDQDYDKVQLNFVHENPEIDNSIADSTHNDTYEIVNITNIDNNTRSGYIVLDVENNTANLDIIQLAYIVYNDENKELKKVNSYVKNRFVDNRTGQITGITTDILRKKGIEFIDIIKTFAEDVTKVNTVCGHHVYTDISKIKSNIQKFKFKIRDGSDIDIDIFDSLMIDDTATLYKSVKNRGRSITLQNMYEELFNNKMIDAHDALSDVKHTAKCYVELQRLNKIAPIKTVTVKKNVPTKKLLSSSLITGDKNDIKRVQKFSDGKKLTKTKINKNDIVSSQKSKPISKNVTKISSQSTIKKSIKNPKENNTDKKDIKPSESNGKPLDQGLSSIMGQSFFA
jgi:hypothetical protein